MLVFLSQLKRVDFLGYLYLRENVELVLELVKHAFLLLTSLLIHMGGFFLSQVNRLCKDSAKYYRLILLLELEMHAFIFINSLG